MLSFLLSFLSKQREKSADEMVERKHNAKRWARLRELSRTRRGPSCRGWWGRPVCACAQRPSSQRGGVSILLSFVLELNLADFASYNQCYSLCQDMVLCVSEIVVFNDCRPPICGLPFYPTSCMVWAALDFTSAGLQFLNFIDCYKYWRSLNGNGLPTSKELFLPTWDAPGAEGQLQNPCVSCSLLCLTTGTAQRHQGGAVPSRLALGLQGFLIRKEDDG